MYVYRITKTKSIYYCGKDLPKFLEDRRKAGLLKITEEFTEAKETAIEVLKVSEVEEEVVESLPVPKKKTAKKTAD
jgi:hypothetical protein